MSLEKLTERIIGDAKKEAKKITEEAQKQASSIKTQATEQATAHKKYKLKETAGRVDDEKQAVLAKARLEARDLILENKQALLNRAFEKALEKINKLSATDYEQLVLNLLVKVSDGTEVVLMADSQTENIVRKANEKLASQGKISQLKASEHKIKDKGFVLIDKVGARTDFTFKTLIDYYRSAAEEEVFSILSPTQNKEQNG